MTYVNYEMCVLNVVFFYYFAMTPTTMFIVIVDDNHMRFFSVLELKVGKKSPHFPFKLIRPFPCNCTQALLIYLCFSLTLTAFIKINFYELSCMESWEISTIVSAQWCHDDKAHSGVEVKWNACGQQRRVRCLWGEIALAIVYVVRGSGWWASRRW